jgi:capsular polysaccharide transport system ATP-binding protein
VIKVSNLTKSYRTAAGPHRVIDNLSFEVPTGKNLALIGRNGQGKSTLMGLLAGAITPDSGTVEFNGAVSWPVGLTGGMQGSLTGRQNVRFVGRVHGKTGADLDLLTTKVQEFAEIRKHFDLPVRTYSSGMRARLNFALSMAFDFNYWLVDEITAVGDIQFREKCAKAMQEKKATGQFVIVSHNPRELLDNCDVALVLGREPRYFESVEPAIRYYSESIKNEKTI